MKKLLGIVVLGLLWFNVGYASLIEFGHCISSNSNTLKENLNNEWSIENYKRYNVKLYKFLEEPIKENNYWSVDDYVWLAHIDEEYKKELLEKNYKKISIKERTVYSINTDTNTITYLNVYTDEFMSYLEQKWSLLYQVLKKNTGSENDKHNLNSLKNTKKTKITKYIISDYVGGIIIAHRDDQLKYYPKERFGIKIDLNNLTVVQNSMDRIHDSYQGISKLCTYDQLLTDSDQKLIKTPDSKKTGSLLKSILKLIN